MSRVALRTGRSGVLGLVLPDISNPLFPQIAQAVERASGLAGYGLLIADSHDEVGAQTATIERLVRQGADGVVVVPRRGSRIGAIDRPAAVTDSPSTPGNTVASDHWGGGAQVARRLVALGHRSLLFLGASPSSNVQKDRIGGMCAALSSGVDHRTLWIEDIEAEHGANAQLGLAGHVRDGVTAIAATSNLHALRALTELQSTGLAIPCDVSVTGFDDLLWARVVHPGLTTLRQDMAAIAERAIAHLVRALSAASLAGPAEAGAAIPMALIERGSTGRASEGRRRRQER